MKPTPNSEQRARALQKPVPGNAESGIVPASKGTAKKLRTEDERIDSALQKMKDSSGIKAPRLRDRLLLQTASAILPHWNSKDITPGKRLELAANSLTEMEPSNATEAMLANQMIATNDAALTFVGQAMLTATSEQKRDDNTERACKFLALFIQQLDAMQRLKGKAGRQKVIVEHVHVYKGGQAIVGAVTPGGQEEGVGDGTEKSGNTP